MMHFPPPLIAGDSIGLVAPARKISSAELEYAEQWMEKWGWKVVKAPNLHGEFHQFSGTDQQRADDINWCLKNPDVKAILCVRGGYGSVRLLDLIDWESFVASPKWIAGYSDITVLLNAVVNRSFAALHCSMPINFPKNTHESLETIAMALRGEKLAYNWPTHPANTAGVARGKLIGGNLSVLYSQRGTPNDLDPTDAILFIEDLDEYLYHIDRMMENFRKGSWMTRLRGMVVGGMTDMNDNAIPFGYSAIESIRRSLEGVDIPVAFGFTAGHLDHNLALIMGAEVDLEVHESGSTLKF